MPATCSPYLLTTARAWSVTRPQLATWPVLITGAVLVFRAVSITGQVLIVRSVSVTLPRLRVRARMPAGAGGANLIRGCRGRAIGAALAH
jgi:hypothetical protein